MKWCKSGSNIIFQDKKVTFRSMTLATRGIFLDFLIIPGRTAHWGFNWYQWPILWSMMTYLIDLTPIIISHVSPQGHVYINTTVEVIYTCFPGQRCSWQQSFSWACWQFGIQVIALFPFIYISHWILHIYVQWAYLYYNTRTTPLY